MPTATAIARIQYAIESANKGQNVKLFIGVEGDPSAFGTGHVLVGVKVNTGEVDWFGFSPTVDLAPNESLKYVSGVPGRMTLEDFDSARLAIPANVTSSNVAQVLRNIEQKVQEGERIYSFTETVGKNCLTTVGDVFSGTGVNVNKIVAESGKQGAGIALAVGLEAIRLGKFQSPQHCFPAFALITLADNTQKPINTVNFGDYVATYDPNANHGRGTLLSGVVTRLFTNITQEFIKITSSCGRINSSMTPGHEILCPDGAYRKAQQALPLFNAMVHADGSIVAVQHERIVYSAATAHLYPQAEQMVYAAEGGLALAPKLERGWATYNFEVKTHHVYIADNARVHNESVLDLVPTDAMPYTATGAFNPNASVLITGYEADGVTPKSAVYSDNTGKIHFLDTAHNANGAAVLLNERVVVTSNDGTLERSYVAYDINRDVNTGNKLSATGTDGSGNTFPEGFDSLGALTSYVFTKAGGGQMSLTGSDIGAVLGSSIGNALGGNSFAAKITVTTLVTSVAQTVAGIISRPTFDANGQRDGSTSLLARFSDGTTSLDQAFSETLTQFNKAVPINLLNNVTGGVSSLLVGELTNALGLTGFAAGAFTTVGTTITTQLVNNLVSMTLGTANLPANFNTIFNTSGQGIYSGFDAVSFGANMAGKLANDNRWVDVSVCG